MTRRIGSAPPGQMSLFLPSADPASEGAARLPDERPVAGVAPYRDMWQVHDTYIFAETRSGVVILDQHSAHERVLYEEAMRAFEAGTAASQRLLFPLALELSRAQRAVVEELSSLLQRLGFEIEPLDDVSVRIQAVPHPHAGFDAEQCFREMLEELAEGSELVNAARTQHQRLALSFACKGSIRAGQPLTLREMGDLFDRLFAAEQPYEDVHGRPTLVQLSLAELRERFAR